MDIKYRQWLKDFKRFHYWGFLDGGFVGPVLGLGNPHGENQVFTGLLDKNGKEIFEGDVLERSDGERWQVHFEDGAFWAGFQRRGGIALWYLVDGLEIIGNIYENPNLLEKS